VVIIKFTELRAADEVELIPMTEKSSNIALSVGTRGCGDARVVMLGQEIREFLIRRLRESSFLPQVRRQIGISLRNGCVSSLREVTQGRRGTASLRVAVFDTSHVKQLLRDTSGDDPGTARRWNQAHDSAAAFSRHFAGNGMRLSDFVAPVSSANGNDGQLGEDDGSSNGGRHFFGTLNAESNVPIGITDSDESLEPGTLSGTSLLLDGHDLQNLILQARPEEIIDDFAFLDGKREEVDLFQRLDLGFFHEATQLGDGNPLLFFPLVATTATASATTTTSATATSSSVAESAPETSAVSTGWCCVRHWWILSF